MKAIWKHGPFFGAQRMKVMGRPVSVGVQDGDLFVWTEVDRDWAFLPNTKEADAQVEWHTLMFVATGMDYDGKYIETVHAASSDGYSYVWHCIEVE